MRKIALSFLFLSIGLSSLYAATESTPAPSESKQEAVAPSKPVPKRSAAEEKKIAETRKRIDEKKTELNGSSWEVVLGSSSDPKMKGEKDTLTFQNGQFSSKNLSKRGFSPTNYTISLPSEDSKTAVWETMQTGKDGLVFIRGEWEKEQMRGDISEQLEGGKKTKEYYFTTASRIAIPPTSKEEEKTGVPKTADSTGTAGSKSGSSADLLVSKEGQKVAAFEPGTTNEQTQTRTKRKK